MIDQDIKIFVLKLLLAADGAPITNETLMAAVANRFSHVALTHGDIRQYVNTLQYQKNIAGTNDELLGVVWLLTPAGKIKAQNLP